MDQLTDLLVGLNCLAWLVQLSLLSRFFLQKKRNKAWDELCQSSEGLGSVKQSSISDVTQTVTLTAELLSMDAKVHNLCDEVGAGEDTVDQSSLRNDISSAEVLLQEEKLQKSKMSKPTLIKVTTGEGSNNPGFIRTFTMIDVSKQRTEAQWKFFGLCYRRKGKLDTVKRCTEDSNAANTDRNHINRFVNHYKRRRIVTAEISSILSTGGNIL